MKTVIGVLFCLAMLASVAVAEKPVDNEDYQIQNPGRWDITGELDEADEYWERGYDYTAPPAPDTCDFPFADHTTPEVVYEAHCIQPTDDTPIEIVFFHDETEVSDTTLYLFCDGFDPALPLENGVFWDDDGGEGLMSAFTLDDNIILTPGVDYILVASVYSPSTALGVYTIQLSDNLMLCEIANETNTWSTLKSMYR